MRLLGKGRVWLDKGEVIPVFCTCGNVYPPEAGTIASQCTRCGKTHFHLEETAAKDDE